MASTRWTQRRGARVRVARREVLSSLRSYPLSDRSISLARSRMRWMNASAQALTSSSVASRGGTATTTYGFGVGSCTSSR